MKRFLLIALLCPVVAAAFVVVAACSLSGRAQMLMGKHE